MAILKPSSLQSSHWYTRDGKAMHTVPNADGDGTRPTTLADSRKLGLFPSVSAILQVLDKPGLDKWKLEQVALAGLRLKRAKDESEEYYIDRVIAESRKKVEAAGDFGTAVHAEMERYWEAKLNRTEFAPNAVTFSHTKPAIEFIESKGIVPVGNEVVLVNYEHGFGGTSDLPCQMPGKSGVILPLHVDYKTKKTEPGKPIEPYADQVMQLAAYAATYWKEQFPRVWGMNLYLSSTEPGRTEAALYPPAMMAAAWEIFKQLCCVWRHLNEFDPRVSLGYPAPVFHQAKMILIAPAGGQITAPPVVKNEDAPKAPPALPPLPPPAPADHPAKGPTMLEVIEGAVLTQNECDGIKFLSPRDCCAMPAGKTDYAWWWHEETKTARVSIRNDGAMREHGWHNAFLAYPANALDIPRSEKAPGKPAPVVKKDDSLPLKEGKKAPATKPKVEAPGPDERKVVKDNKARIKEIEAMPITFGKFKGHAKVKVIGDLPASYLDYLRDVRNIPAHVAEYICYQSISNRIDKALK